MKRPLKAIAVILSAVLFAAVFAACGPGRGGGQGLSNETDVLMFSMGPADGNFNPFFYTSASDGSVISPTQISMMGTTDDGSGVAYGDDEAVVVKDMDEQTTGSGDDQKTVYTFVIKNDLKFSDGAPLTLKDVFFNMYVYLDPAYTGSSTMYSTDIVGLAAYRTQDPYASDSSSFDIRFNAEAEDRMQELASAVEDVGRATGLANIEAIKTALDANPNENLLEDYERLLALLKEEIASNWANAVALEDDEYITTKLASFLYNLGFIYIGKDSADKDVRKLMPADWERDWGAFLAAGEDRLLETVYESLGDAEDFADALYASASGVKLMAELAAKQMSIHLQKQQTDGMRFVPDIDGIKRLTTDVTIDGNTYKADEYEAFSITINGVDPKAIWNFTFAVAPLHYYSGVYSGENGEINHVEEFDFEYYFGVEYGDFNFLQTVVNDKTGKGAPLGAGPYKASDDAWTATGRIQYSEFFKDNTARYMRNEHFLMGAPKIHRMSYQVIDKNNIVEAVRAERVHFGSADAKQSVVDEIVKSPNLAYNTPATLGYGYIGINAGHDALKDVNVRRAIMHSMDAGLTMEYYRGGYAERVYRPMSKESWAYPSTEDITDYYPYKGGAYDDEIKDSVGINEIAAMLDKGGVRVNSDGTRDLKLKYTISGEQREHPALMTFMQSKRILEYLGCTVDISNDPQALTKLATGSLQVWAAAWNSTIDPDMFQVYHMDSRATNIKSWGFDKIKAGGEKDTIYGREEDGKPSQYANLVELSKVIDRARSYTDRTQRKADYAKALDLVMDLAVELPTYQRDDLYLYDKTILDESTMTPRSRVTSIVGPIDELWKLSFRPK